jgi:hypothetical protein
VGPRTPGGSQAVPRSLRLEYVSQFHFIYALLLKVLLIFHIFVLPRLNEYTTIHSVYILVKAKLPLYVMQGPSSYSFFTSALDSASGQRDAPAALYPLVKDHRYPLYRRLLGLRSGLDTEARGKLLRLCRR